MTGTFSYYVLLTRIGRCFLTQDVNVFLSIQVCCTYVMYVYVQHNVALYLQILLTKNSHENADGTQNLPLLYNLVIRDMSTSI